VKPDDVCAQYDRRKTLTVCVVDYGDEEFSDPMVLIEGYAPDLEFIGNLLIAQAREERDCGFHISPVGAGNAFFSAESTHGIYIHRLPCLTPPPPRR